MFPMKASMVIFSHLSDMPFQTDAEAIRTRSEFIKYIILHVKDDLTQEIEPDVLYKEFLDKRKKK